ncbi:hypothetical protein M885DRAFT_548052 [Pelagophyceae sp. CCMP2097]|nr:hypothetical protein M885DRAFT_548052 [Pelagophyceae sp. CCMP2097]|mmetsp:Transcript_27258/g.93701  ORF Transcript_27258/g.93701 Transcript_27258/m.93701 type:complete len:485 (+) Transcript_27258:79-1533(+)
MRLFGARGPPRRDSPAFGELLAAYARIGLASKDAYKMRDVFDRVDHDNSGSISTAEFLAHFDVEETPLATRIFDYFDADASNSIELNEFGLSMWGFCSLSWAGLAAFTLALFGDADGVGQRGGAAFIQAVFGVRPSAAKTAATRKMEELRTASVNIEPEAWKRFIVESTVLVTPLFTLHRALRRKCGGLAYWALREKQRTAKYGDKMLRDIDSGQKAAAAAEAKVGEAAVQTSVTAAARDAFDVALRPGLSLLEDRNDVAKAFKCYHALHAGGPHHVDKQLAQVNGAVKRSRWVDAFLEAARLEAEGEGRKAAAFSEAQRRRRRPADDAAALARLRLGRAADRNARIMGRTTPLARTVQRRGSADDANALLEAAKRDAWRRLHYGDTKVFSDWLPYSEAVASEMAEGPQQASRVVKLRKLPDEARCQTKAPDARPSRVYVDGTAWPPRSAPSGASVASARTATSKSSTTTSRARATAHPRPAKS